MGEKAKGAEMIVFVCSPYLAVLQGRRKQKEALKQVYAYAKAGSKAVKDMVIHLYRLCFALEMCLMRVLKEIGHCLGVLIY